MKTLALCILLATLPLAAAAAGPAPGDYLTERGWGRLTIHADQRFELTAVGANAHHCALEGRIDAAGTARLSTMEGDPDCVVAFTAEGAGLQVTARDSEACRYYCGARAWFEGLYVQPAPACRPAAVQRTRARFKQLYDAKQHAAAKDLLQPLLSDCSSTLGWIEEGWIRNDLALTWHKLGDEGACQQLLQPLAEDAAKTDEELRETYPPSDADGWLPVARATRHNLKLCGAPATRL